MKACGFVFARSGSRGVPGKNIRPLCGKPLIAYAVESGLASGCVERMVVSTDSPEIAAIAVSYGAEAPFLRPAELAGDTSAEILAWKHAIRFLRELGDDFDVFVSLPATAPLRTPDDVRQCVELYKAGNCDVVVTCTEAGHSPYFNMIALDGAGFARVALSGGEGIPFRRQDTPKLYDMTTIAYVASADFILGCDSLWDGLVKAVVVDRIHAVDIDNMFDMEVAEHFMRKRMEHKE